MSDREDSGDVRLGKCPRCGTVDHRKVQETPKFAPSFDEEKDESEDFFPLSACSACGLGGVARGTVRGGYYLRELREVIDEPPSMGRPCLHCGARIPKFVDLPQDDAHAIRRQIYQEGEDAAIASLVAATGCPQSWAKIWVTHPFGPRRPRPQWVGPPCPQCSRPLRSGLARQCVECGLDWHDPGVQQVG